MNFDLGIICDGLPFYIQVIRLIFILLIIRVILILILIYPDYLIAMKFFKNYRKFLSDTNNREKRKNYVAEYLFKNKNNRFDFIYKCVIEILNIHNINRIYSQILFNVNLQNLYFKIDRILKKIKNKLIIPIFISFFLMAFIVFNELNTYSTKEVLDEYSARHILGMFMGEIYQTSLIFFVTIFFSILVYFCLVRMNHKLNSEIDDMFKSDILGER